MDKINNSRDHNAEKKQSGRRNHSIGRNTTKWYKRKWSDQGITEIRWPNLGR